MRTFILFFFLFLFLFSSSQCQMYQNDPFTIINLDELSKNDVRINKIKKITSFFYNTQNGIKVKDGFLNYYVNFNIYGNPTFWHSGSSMNVCKSILEFKKEVEFHDFYFEYDSSQNLIHIKEIIHQGDYDNLDENDIYFKYDNQNKLIAQTISEKLIYKPKLKYRGVLYKNDTTLIKYYLNYDIKNNVTTVIKWYNELHKNSSEKPKVDTNKCNCPFDSIFVSKTLKHGQKIDSSGKVIEFTTYMIYAKPLSGSCINPDSPNDIINKIYYNKDGKINKIESFLRKGDFSDREIYQYDNKGLLISKKLENIGLITNYKYEFY